MTGSVLREAARYAGTLFLVGCVLGTVREMLVSPAIGPVAAMTIETPLMLSACVLVATRRAGRVDWSPAEAMRVGLAAMPMLVAMEEALTRALRGGSILEHWMRQSGLELAMTVSGLLGFAFIPALVTLSKRNRMRISLRVPTQ